ncbi:MAG: hypothetical protein ACKO5C_00445 [Ferruginibacter sp.]
MSQAPFKTPVAFFLLTVCFGFLGCYNDKEELLYPNTSSLDCTTISAKYSTDIAPIMQTKCAVSGCHNASSSAAGVILQTHAQVAAKANQIKQTCIVSKSMPPAGPLPLAEQNAIQCWINAGTPNN